MLRSLLACTLACLALTGCANGWPSVRHPPKTTAAACIPTTSKIDRADCNTTTPATGITGGDMDRTQGPIDNTMTMPGKTIGGR